MGRVVLAVLDHRDGAARPAWSARGAACRRRPSRPARSPRSPCEGPLDFSLTGVLATLLQPLAEAEISVFTISTFDTDWVLVPVGDADRAAEEWRRSRARRRPRRPQSTAHEEQQETTTMSVTHPAGFTAAGVEAGLKTSGGKDVALVVNTGPDLRLRLGVHRQPLQGQPDPVERGGRQGRHRPRGRAQLRRRQLLHRRRGLPDHARRRRAGRRRPRHRRRSTWSSARPA